MLRSASTHCCRLAAFGARIFNVSPDAQVTLNVRVYRPFLKDDFNFMFTTLNLHDYSHQLVDQSPSNSSPRIVISLESENSADINAVAKKFMHQPVYVNWPHFMLAKVEDIFDANYSYDSEGDSMRFDSADFPNKVDRLKSQYLEHGIDVGDITMLAYVRPLKCTTYECDGKETNQYKLTNCWHQSYLHLVAVQTMVPAFMPERKPQVKRIRDVFNVTDVFLFSQKSYHYGELAKICDTQDIETTGRVNILSSMNREPNFEKAIETHDEWKAQKSSEFKQSSFVASVLGISEKVLGKITGLVPVVPEKSANSTKKINIGLLLKSRSVTSVLIMPEYVNSNGRQFFYSKLTIDLVHQYMEKFPLVFELVNSSQNNFLKVSEFGEKLTDQTGSEYLAKVVEWLHSMPHHKNKRTPINTMRVSENALVHVREAVEDPRTKDVKVLKIKMKWHTLYVPDLNDVFSVPCPTATFKLLDRIVIVRSGYPVPIGAKGSVICVEPQRQHSSGSEIFDHNLFALDILMDSPFVMQTSVGRYKEHRIYRTHSTNMLVNISFGRVV